MKNSSTKRAAAGLILLLIFFCVVYETIKMLNHNSTDQIWIAIVISIEGAIWAYCNNKIKKMIA